MTVDSLKLFISSPLALFALMVLASVGNGLKQIAVVRQTGNPMKCIEYFGHIPETVTVMVGNVLAFILLLSTGQLNVASALAVGYGANSLADLLPKGRSYALKSTPDLPEKVTPPK
jgi:hypothetical protein